MPEQVNFQINGFLKINREDFKKWCKKNRVSMREMMEVILANKDKIQPIIKEHFEKD